MIFEPDEFTQLQDAVRQIYKKDFLTNQEMVSQFNKSLGIKEEATRQFEEKKERDKSIGKVDVIDTGKGDASYRELKQLFMLYADENQNDLFDLNDLRDADKSGELMKIKEVLDDLINTPNMDKQKIIYYKSQVNMIDDFIYNKGLMTKRIKNIQLKKRETFDMSKEDRNIDRRPPFLKEINKTTNQKPPKKLATTPRPPRTKKPPSSPRKTKGRPPSIKGTAQDELIIEKINKSEFMRIIPSKYKSMDDLDELQNYWNDADKVADNIRKIEDENLRRKTEKRYEDRYRAIQLRSDDLENQENQELRKGAVESKSEISGNGMKQRKSKNKSNKKSNNKSLGKQEQIYYLLSQRAGNNNKLMKKRLQKNKK